MQEEKEVAKRKNPKRFCCLAILDLAVLSLPIRRNFVLFSSIPDKIGIIMHLFYGRTKKRIQVIFNEALFVMDLEVKSDGWEMGQIWMGIQVQQKVSQKLLMETLAVVTM